MSKLVFLAVAPLLIALAACGGKSIVNGDDGGSASAGNASAGNASGGSAAAGTDAGTGSTGGKGQAGGGGAEVCNQYDDDTAASVNVVLTNMTDAPIYVGAQKVSCEVPPLFDVADATGAPLPTISRCRLSCLGAKSGVGGCTAICLFPISVMLEPGEVRSTTWDGLFSLQGALPGSCSSFDAGMPTISCDQAKRIEPGTFTFSAHAGTSVDCSQTGGESCSPCMADGSGGCTTPGSLIGGKILTATSTVVLDESYGIYPAAGAASSPSPGSGASPSGSRALAIVNLVFGN